MHPNVRSAALRAAAKTAIALSLAGGTLAVLPGCSASHQPSPAPVADAGASGCDERLAALELIDGGELGTTRFASDDARHDREVGDCCAALDERARIEGMADIDPALGLACCDVVVFAQGRVSWSPLGCTPWGPPCPPEAPV